MNDFECNLKEYHDSIVGFLDFFVEGGYWQLDQPITENWSATVLKLIAVAAGTDLENGKNEIRFVRDFFNLNSSLNDIRETLVWMLKDFSEFLDDVPDILVSAVEYDQDHGTTLGALILEFFKYLGPHVVSLGKNIRDEKTIVLNRYFNNLTSYLTKNNVSVVVKETGLNPDTSITECNMRENKRKGVNSQEKDENEHSLEELLRKLDRLVGLSKVKQDVVSLTNLIRVRKMREDRGLQVMPMSLHLVFTGNPGTGKTTVARLLANIYKSMGLLSKGHLVETDRSGLVAAYVGQTAIKVKELVQEALGGILFIDEAYSLASNRSENDYGREATDTLLKLMEDHRNELVVIVAGYTNEMQEFLESNPGLKSRFNKFIHFEDYSPDELFLIFERMCEDGGYLPSQEASQLARSVFKLQYESREQHFGNARMVRNIFEKSVTHHADRLAGYNSPTEDELMLLHAEDIPNDLERV